MHICKSSKMGRKRFKFNSHGILLLHMLVIANLHASTAKEIPGFLNIDCGSGASAPYEDPKTKLTWVNDERFIRAGIDGNISSFDSPNLQNSLALSTFRYFPKHQKKHCYELPLTKSNTSFLLRTMFFYSSEDMRPSQFNLAINATVWYTVSVNFPSGSGSGTITAEGIFFSPGPLVNFCLIEGDGTSFISSLELRELDREGNMYSFEGSNSMCFFNIWRGSFGPYNETRIIRYPDDPYDRFWDNASMRIFKIPTDIKYISNSSAIEANSSADVNYIPTRVMLEASLFNSNDSISLWTEPASNKFSANDVATGEAYFVYGIFYFQDLTSVRETRNFTISINGHQSPPLTIDKNGITKYAYPYFLSPSSLLELKFENENASEHLSSLNAGEAYQTKLYDFTRTENSDDKAIKFLREAYSLKDWEGDPCAPVPLFALSCIRPLGGDNQEMTVDSLNLSYLGRPINMSRLAEDDISFSGLKYWSLTHSNVDNRDFDMIRDQLLNPYSLISLDLSYNNITKIPPAAGWPVSMITLSYLNFTNNNIQGEMISFDVENNTIFDYLVELNLSYNQITSVPLSWGNESNAALPWLTKLDISHNLISQNVSSLDGILDTANSNINWSNHFTSWQRVNYSFNESSLTELRASDNNFGGRFNSVLYFSILKALEYLNLDGNKIEGVLDLNLWVDSWQQHADNHSYEGGTFSLVNNSIYDIRPSATELEPILLNFSSHFQHFNKSRRIILDGNPYCKGLGHAKLFTERYFCRTQGSKKSNLLKILLPTLLGGLLLIMIITWSVATVIWRLRKQVLALQRIQDELAKRKVQPLFFSFHDIKVATKNFHSNNMIGKGGFGVVYKGILADGTPVAVKKLFNLEHVQVLDDFLNEVVLVAGIKHKNLIQLKGCCIKDQERMLVYDLAENGNLEQALYGKGKSQQLLDMDSRINLCIGIAQGLYYLHAELQPRIIHRDIKPANILLDEKFNAKIADFGLARFVAEDDKGRITRKAGTWGYLAPEYELSDKMDVFSFGILVLVIMSGKGCFHHEIPTDDQYLRTWAHEMDKSNYLLSLLPEYLRRDCDENAITSLLKVAVNCTHMIPKYRPSMFSVLTTLGGIFIESNPFVENDGEENPIGLNAEMTTFYESDEEDVFPFLNSERTVGTSPVPPTYTSEIQMRRTSSSFSRRSNSFVSRD